jgi:hypothetical protein
MIIGIVGNIGEGKDTIASYLEDNHDFTRESFAGTLKDAVAAVFGWNRFLLDGQTKESREWREQVDTWWEDRLNMPGLTPRLILQLWGTEVCRRSFHDDIWVASLENKLRKVGTNVVISDCRFPNEFTAIKNSGGIMIRVKRGPEPEWYQYVSGALAGNIDDLLLLKHAGIHESEWAWYGLNVNHVIENNGTLDDLHAKVASIVNI